MRSSLESTDFTARLCDVTPKGKSVNICDGIVRLSPNARPDGGGVHLLTMDLGATAFCFRAGHRIRLQVASGSHPQFNRNLGTGQSMVTAIAMRVADQAVLHDSLGTRAPRGE